MQVSNDSKRLRDIIGIDSELNRIQDVDILLERILLEARRMVHADAGSIYVRQGDKLVINYAQNDTAQAALPPGQKLIYRVFTIEINEHTISGYVAATGTLLNIPDVYHIPAGSPYSYDTVYDRLSGYRTKSMLTVPLVDSRGAILGVIQIINPQDAEGNVVRFSADDEAVITHFANNASVALERAKMTRAIILRMIQMAELRDPKETGPHVNRVAGFAVEIYERWAQRVGIPAKQIEKNRDTLRMAAMLHDVGKVAISDVILKKPARFTPDEFEIMKTHAVHGARLFLDRQSEFDELAIVVALNHHENWDGTGYPGHVDLESGSPTRVDENDQPLGKRGKEIPIFGRIVALADVYDALRSKRTYKEAWDEQEVLEEMRRMSGNKFDPELVDIFFEVLPSIQNIAARYVDA